MRKIILVFFALVAVLISLAAGYAENDKSESAAKIATESPSESKDATGYIHCHWDGCQVWNHQGSEWTSHSGSGFWNRGYALQDSAGYVHCHWDDCDLHDGQKPNWYHGSMSDVKSQEHARQDADDYNGGYWWRCDWDGDRQDQRKSKSGHGCSCCGW